MSMNKCMLALALAASLAGCAGQNGKKVTQRQAIELSCASVSTANKVLIQAITLHKISKAEDLAKIQRAKDYVDPICNPASGVLPNLTEIGMQEFNAQVSELESQKAKVE